MKINEEEHMFCMGPKHMTKNEPIRNKKSKQNGIHYNAEEMFNWGQKLASNEESRIGQRKCIPIRFER